VSDFTDNAVGLMHTTGPKLSRLAGKYRPLVPVLRELILRQDTPFDPDVRQLIAAQLDDAEHRFAVICRDDTGAGQGQLPAAGRNQLQKPRPEPAGRPGAAPGRHGALQEDA
jgi:hypothetical protein